MLRQNRGLVQIPIPIKDGASIRLEQGYYRDLTSVPSSTEDEFFDCGKPCDLQSEDLDVDFCFA
jgi:hypothetical protein